MDYLSFAGIIIGIAGLIIGPVSLIGLVIASMLRAERAKTIFLRTLIFAGVCLLACVALCSVRLNNLTS